MKMLVLGVLVTLLLTTFVFVMISGAAIVELALWAGRSRIGRSR